MGGTSGHVSMGLAFLIIGLWHLFNTIKLHSLHPQSFSTQPWFPISRPLKHLEPVTIILVTTAFVSMELFIGRNPLSPDGTIPSKYLPHLEHSIIALSFFVYAFFALLFDKINDNNKNNINHPPAQDRNLNGLAHLLQAVSFGLQLLILHLHSTDHMGIEGQYHWLLQIVAFVSLITTILAIGYPEGFVNSFMRALSVAFQGVWLIVTGIMLWTPGMLPKDCFLKAERGRVAVLCRGDRALDRAKALVNIQFGLCLILLTVFSISLYVVLIRVYPREKVEYRPLTKVEEQDDEGDFEFECQRRSTSRTSISM